MNSNPKCRLCRNKSELFFETKNQKKYYRCGQCWAIFLDSRYYLLEKDQIERYKQHNNDVNDPGYQKFVTPIVSQIIKKYKTTQLGLDFGAGTGPVAAKLLIDKGYAIKLYDPFFWNNPEALKRKYDFIICSEVIEHFHYPRKSFKLLKKLLKKNSTLFCMTDVYSEDINFKKWYYKNDPTHVFFYQQKTLEKVKSLLGFSGLKRQNRLIEFLA